MKVSVALTTYNGEKYILKQLHSLLFQRHTIDEVIICDDASTDDTPNIIKNFIKKNQLSHWHLNINSKNIGFINNFKNAIKKTTGDVIFLCDQDDIWYKTKVGSMLNRFESDERVKGLFSGFTFIDENDNIISVHKNFLHSNNNLIKFRIEPFETVKINFDTICSYNISPGCTFAFTREVKDIFLSKTKNVCIHDWELALIAAFLDGLYFFNTPLTNYRIHSENAIGLSEIVKNNNQKKLISFDVRLNKAKKMLNYLESMEPYYYLLNETNLNILKEKTDFVNMRFNALSEKSLSKILNLYKYKNNYFKAVTFKGRIADIICILKK